MRDKIKLLSKMCNAIETTVNIYISEYMCN